jgi:hypothetical protein
MAAPAPGRGAISLTSVELLHHELVAYLIRRHDEGRFASEELWAKLEQAGYGVGRRFAERCVCLLGPARRAFFAPHPHAHAFSPPPPPLNHFPLPHPGGSLALSREGPRAQEVLDVVKFVCRDVWMELHQKQIDKLQTNNKGVFVLQDFNYRWVRFVSAAPGESTAQAAVKYLLFPCGVIRGALAACDVEASVNADISQCPRAIFKVTMKGAAL